MATFCRPTDDFQHNDRFLAPALEGEDGVAVPNPARDPAAELQTGNLPFDQTSCVHTVEDVSVYASGPGATRFNAFLDNTELFHAMIDALGLIVPVSGDAAPRTESDADVAAEPVR